MQEKENSNDDNSQKSRSKGNLLDVEMNQIDSSKIDYDQSKMDDLEVPTPDVERVEASEGREGSGNACSATVQGEQLSANIKHRGSFMQDQNHLEGSSIAAHSVSKQVSINDLINLREDENIK